MKKKIDKKEIERLVLEEELTIMDVIDVVVGINAIIGVGLITLGDVLQQYCYDKIKKGNDYGR